MALVDPNIAMSYRGIEIPNQLAQYAQLSQIQNAQNQNRMANMQIDEYQRAREEEEGLRNYLTSTDFTKPENRAGLLKFGKTGREYVKTLTEQDAAALTAKNVQSQISERDFGLQDKKLKFAWNAVGSASNPQAAITELNKGVKDGIFDMKSATAEIQQLQNMTPEQYQQYRVQKVMGILDAKDKLGFMLPKTRDRDIGGMIEQIQDNPAMAGYGQRVMGSMPVAKTATIGERTAQGQLGLAQQKFAWEQANPGFELKEAEDGSIVGVNKRTLQAFPVTVGGAALAVAPMASANMLGARLPAPVNQAIPSMTSVLDQQAPVATAGGVPLRGKGTALTESQGNATAYGMRMREANAILEPLEKLGKTNTGLIKGAVGGTVGLVPFIGDKLEDVSGSIFNALPRVLGGLSPEQQQVAQARINFITAILRKESGAAIGASEFATAEKNYFPKPGDDDATIAQKQAARKTAIKAMEIQAGPGAKQMGGAVVIPGATTNNPLGLPGL
jgi:hypothetical protein